jgi:energy-coupling factor transporter ATP-binding protein EcfA2
MASNDLLILGQTNYRNVRQRFGIRPVDRRRHVYIVGKTGTGKSTLLLNCIVQDIQAGRGLAVIDPHGDTDFPIGFNVLAFTEAKYRPLVASGLVQVFKKIWGDSWGPRLEYVLRNSFLALLEKPGNTLLGVSRLFTDDGFRRKIVAGITDPVLKNFWAVEFEQYPKVFRTETISPIQNKVGQFLMNPIARNILGQPKSRLDITDVLDCNRVLLVNLAKGRIGEDTSSLLGSLLVTQLYLAALRRADRPTAERRDFFLYIDELQSFATDDFPSLLSEARKYGLNVAGMANQFLLQLPELLRASILGNVGTLIAFAVGSEDAQALEQEYRPEFTALDLLNLPKFSVYLKLSIDGTTSRPFSADTLAPWGNVRHGLGAKIIAQSRLRYAVSRAHVEGRVRRWLEHT